MPFKEIPKAFFDPNVSDRQLQEMWTAGAEREAARLRKRLHELHRELIEVREALTRAESFLDDAHAARQRYRSQGATVSEPAKARRLSGERKRISRESA